MQSLSPASKFVPTSCRKDRNLLLIFSNGYYYFINFSAVKNIYDNQFIPGSSETCPKISGKKVGI